jgi:hypothetical protein
MYKGVVTGSDIDGYLSTDSAGTVRIMKGYPDSRGTGIGGFSGHAQEASGVDLTSIKFRRPVGMTGKE